MNQYLVLLLDGLLYVAACGLLVVLTALCVRLFYRGHLRASWMTAVVALILIATAKSVVDSQVGTWLPELDPYPQMALGALATFLAAGVVVYWRYTCSITSAMATGLIVVLAMNGLSMGLPRISERLLPPGPRMAEYIDSAYTRTRQAREATRDFKTVNESARTMLAASLHTLADLSSKAEFEALKANFRGGVKFWAERKAEWDAMTPEEREANRRAMAEFMAEQGIAADRHSLAALRNASGDDVQNLVAFMREMRTELPAAPATAVAPRPAAESLQILLRNIRGHSFTAEDHETMATFARIFVEQGLDAAVAQTRTELVTQQVNPEWAGTFLAAMLEAKSGLPITVILAETGDLAGLPEVAGGQGAPAQTAPPVAPVVRTVSLPTKFGYVRVPRGFKEVDEITAAANTMPVTGFLVGGDRVRVAMGGRSLGIGEVYTVTRGARTFAFRMEEVADGLLHVSGVGID